MFNKIASTFITRGISALISFAVLIITAKVLGAEIRGNISLLILGISFITMISQVAGGPALIYLIPKSNISSLVGVSYIWAAISCLVFSFILSATNFIPEFFFYHLLFISLLQCLSHLHLVILLGKEKINIHNLIVLAQVFTHIIFMAFFVFIWDQKTIESFIWSIYISNILTYILSLIAIQKYFVKFNLFELPGLLKTMFKNGTYTLVANITLLLSVRMSYYYLNLFTGTAAVGIFSAGVSVTESVLLLSSSVSLIIFMRIANSSDTLFAQNLTIRLSKICFILTLPCLFLLLLLPKDFYNFLFGEEFATIKDVIMALSVGIAAISFSMIYSHYFAGMGKYHINAIASSISFSITLVAGYFIIPIWGITGAGWVASMAYLASSGFHFVVFLKHTGANPLYLAPTLRDISFFNKYLLNFNRKTNS
ncbi:MAG: oligosaccharide flippase family protein [Bacteroidetes bacterium]|nr:oligosaccharide flippase family protein [Bacteroidota bacterium]HET6243564.1 polysaccharide biosynthesis C-terminal domain-containing protein [Bacteroidia bacterium]